MFSQSELVIETGKFVHNWQFFRRFQPNCQIVPVLKSDAYGHGLVPAARALEKAGADPLAVFNLGEAEVLRQAGIAARIWVLEGIQPCDLPAAFSLQITSACWSF